MQPIRRRSASVARGHPRHPGNAATAVELNDPVTGRRIRRLTTPPRHNVHAYYDISPWSPDGMRIVYASNTPGQPGAEIWVMDADGGRARRIASHPSFNLHTGAHQAWADDRTVVLPATRDGQAGMRLIGVDAPEDRFVALPGQIGKLSADGRHGLAIDPRGEAGIVDMRTLAYTRICTLEQVRALTPHRREVEGTTTHIQNPRWTPDGSAVLIVHCSTEAAPAPGRDGNRAPALVEVFVYDIPTREFSHVARIGHHPGWHPNGRDILFVWHDPETGKQDLRVVDRRTGSTRVIFDAEHVPAGHPSFHPTHHHLLVTDAYGGRFGYGIVLVDLRRQRLEHLASMPLGEDPSTAPQARGADPPNHGSWSYPRWRLNPHPCWTPDGAGVFYADITTGTAQLHVVDTTDVLAA